MHPITQDAILRGIQQAYDKSSGGSSSNTNKIQHFFPATGKSRKGAMDSLGPIVGPLLHNCPGVYIQGLYCVDKQGNVVFEKRLSSDAIRAAEELVAMFDLSIVGYDGDELYTTQQTDVVRDLSEIYGEPTVEVLMDKETGYSAIKLADHDRGLHKLLLMDNDVDKLALVRVLLEELAKKHDATVTQALPTMLELLPTGCSKANGVQRVCEALGINPAEELLALGDAENDLGMLQMACIGVAVGNACPLARDAADFIMKERHDEGGAGLAMNLFAFDE
jgi:hydroxymethylpyrimidine pyrophosphatase-like HAD family hydrolase